MSPEGQVGGCAAAPRLAITCEDLCSAIAGPVPWDSGRLGPLHGTAGVYKEITEGRYRGGGGEIPRSCQRARLWFGMTASRPSKRHIAPVCPSQTAKGVKASVCHAACSPPRQLLSLPQHARQLRGSQLDRFESEPNRWPFSPSSQRCRAFADVVFLVLTVPGHRIVQGSFFPCCCPKYGEIGNLPAAAVTATMRRCLGVDYECRSLFRPDGCAVTGRPVLVWGPALESHGSSTGNLIARFNGRCYSPYFSPCK